MEVEIDRVAILRMSFAGRVRRTAPSDGAPARAILAGPTSVPGAPIVVAVVVVVIRCCCCSPHCS